MDEFVDMDVVVNMKAAWNEIAAYRIITAAPMLTVCRADDFFGRPLNIETDMVPFLNPFGMRSLMENPERVLAANRIRDLSSSLIRGDRKGPQEVLSLLMQADGIKNYPPGFVEGVLRCCIANGLFEVSDCHERSEFFLKLSERQRPVEERRMYAASLANELKGLSERVRHMIKHPAIVGGYREVLLQGLLKKHLPERYHVATGFILGCHRQIDVLIYDRIDCAPIFREGDLVVVSPEAVRAAIEVKTDLNSKTLKKSIELMYEIAQVDNSLPPFFRGIFAFDSNIGLTPIANSIIDFHAKEPFSYDDALGVRLILSPYEHFTALCVLGKHFLCVDYILASARRWVPVLISKKSASGLDANAAYFMQMLLSHLQLGPVKLFSGREFDWMLGEDTQCTLEGKLVADDKWGPYYRYEEGIEETRDELDESERLISSVRNWLQGDAWREPRI